MTRTPPFPRSWWVEPPRLLAGYYPGARNAAEARNKLQALLGSGIRTFIRLQEADETGWDDEPFVPYDRLLQELAAAQGVRVTCLQFPFPDCDLVKPGQMLEVLDAIDSSLDNGKPVYVHCWGGHGRTAMVVGCWLVRHGRSGQQALERIRQLREAHDYLRANPAPQTQGQRQLVLDWHQHDPAVAKVDPRKVQDG